MGNGKEETKSLVTIRLTITGERSILAKTQAAEFVTKAMSATTAAQIRKQR